MVYCAYTDVNLLTNLTSSDVANADITSIITYATTQLNNDINIEVIRERVEQIDSTRQNQINGINTVYYIKNWEGKYIGDRNNDGSITTSDVIVYLVASDGTETTATVSTIDSDDGKITLSSAPASGYQVYITYCWCFKDPSTPDALIKLACVYLSAALCYEKINRGLSPEQVWGNVRFRRDMEAGNNYFMRYREIINQINSTMGDYKEVKTF